MRTDTVEEPTVVRNDDRTTGEVLQSFFECPECVHINIVFYEGSYSEYEEYKRKLLGDVEPKRVRYRKLIVD